MLRDDTSDESTGKYGLGLYLKWGSGIFLWSVSLSLSL